MPAVFLDAGDGAALRGSIPRKGPAERAARAEAGLCLMDVATPELRAGSAEDSFAPASRLPGKDLAARLEGALWREARMALEGQGGELAAGQGPFLTVFQTLEQLIMMCASVQALVVSSNTLSLPCFKRWLR